MATHIGYSVPAGSLDFWNHRLEQNLVHHDAPAEKFGEQYIALTDPDGLPINLVAPSTTDNRKPWVTSDVNDAVAIKGFHSITLTLKNVQATADILTEVFGYKLLKQDGNVYRYVTDAVENAAIVDLVEVPNGVPGVTAGGTNHHVAFRVTNEEILMRFREKIVARGLYITEKIDRNYFYSLYFREPGGVLFEIATDNPGFATDETVSELGLHLKLPPQYEGNRAMIEQALPKIER
jgi:glyoxalase family protein